MRKTTLTFFLVIFSCASIIAQSTDKPPQLVGMLPPETEDASETLSTIFSIINYDFNIDKDVLAIRLCSNDPLPIAVAYAAGLPVWSRSEPYLSPIIAERTFQQPIPISKIFFLRQNKNCKIVKNYQFLTEYWIVPQTAKFPDYVESNKAENITAYNLNSNADFYGETKSNDKIRLTPKYFKILKNKLLEMLQQDEKSFVLLEMPFRGVSNKIITANTLETKRFLISNRISRHRIFVKKYGFYSEDKEDKYPAITIIYQK